MSADSSSEKAAQGTGRTSRRFAIKTLAVGAAGVAGAAAGVGGSAMLEHIGQGEPRRWRFFTDDEAKLVVAICEQIIPADQDPGATDAGVINYIDKQLVGHFQKHQEDYRRGLAVVQQLSGEMHGKPFESLAWDDQTKLLKALEKGQVPKELKADFNPTEFFRMMVEHTMQG
ncbi:MAG: gluconate 2-dehydrogenase subunit 3 family protein, partial [Planctomycetota bacterium]